MKYLLEYMLKVVLDGFGHFVCVCVCVCLLCVSLYSCDINIFKISYHSPTSLQSNFPFLMKI